MTTGKTKKITISICVPTKFELQVKWDADHEEAEIAGATMAMIQQDWTPSSLWEQLGEEDAAEIDRLARKAFEVEDEGKGI